MFPALTDPPYKIRTVPAVEPKRSPSWFRSASAAVTTSPVPMAQTGS